MNIDLNSLMTEEKQPVSLMPVVFLKNK